MKFRVKYLRWLQLMVAVALCCILLSVNPRVAKATTQFYLPFPASSKYHVTQTWHGEQSHSNYYNRYAVDFRMPIGEPVVAVADGTVIRSSKGKTDRKGACDRSYISKAHYVVVDHGHNISSLYLHLSQVDVSVGETISQGQVIGKSGDTGWACGAHLHFTFQQTDTINRYAGKSIRIGFIETKNDEPLWGMSYMSKNILLAKNDLQDAPQDLPPEAIGAREAPADVKNASLDAAGNPQDIETALLAPQKLPDSNQALGAEVKLRPIQNGLLDLGDLSPPAPGEPLEGDSTPEDIQPPPLETDDDTPDSRNESLEIGDRPQDDKLEDGQNDSPADRKDSQNALEEWIKANSKPKKTQSAPPETTVSPEASLNPQAVDQEFLNWLNSNQPQTDP